MKRLGFHVDLSGCIGCKACQVACKDKHDLGEGVIWRRVVEVTGGSWERRNGVWVDLSCTYYVSVACMHCEEPICVEVCPTKAMRKREDGVVFVESERCIGCRYCEWACPYAAPRFDPQAGVMTKCDLCRDHLAEGRAPACVEACPARILTLQEVTAPGDASTATYPLPPPELTQPTTSLAPHRDVDRAAECRPHIGNEEEL
jgi:anaerobic dimethyl sulfoxide reductase subunit B (iron-sulfur subunit)